MATPEEVLKEQWKEIGNDDSPGSPPPADSPTSPSPSSVPEEKDRELNALRSDNLRLQGENGLLQIYIEEEAKKTKALEEQLKIWRQERPEHLCSQQNVPNDDEKDGRAFYGVELEEWDEKKSQ